MRIFRGVLMALSAVAILGSTGCAVYEQPYGPRVVVPAVPVIVAPSWGYYGYGPRHWRRW
ncbi:hypothetical protein ACO0LB_14900 [Undibacterium sp. SXout7W]|uniref:hypothetical protein n=1 Tax=Undibacterium sp. SXout7W TaxID=3413049 RepID=UPI003BF23D62